MQQLVSTAKLLEHATDSHVDAGFIHLTSELAGEEIDDRWWMALPRSKVPIEDEPDRLWAWYSLVFPFAGDIASECVGLQTADGRIQGAIIYSLDGRSALEPGEGVVWAHYLATAPWNRRWLAESPQYSGVGKALLFRAVCHSYLLGLWGRVLLHSVPLERTIAFYRRFGFAETGYQVENMPVFELPRQRALDWMKQAGVLP